MGVPLYLQVADQIRRGVIDGEHMPGQRLASESDLARTLGISRGTLRQALGALARQGVIKTVPGRGTFVQRDPPTAKPTYDGPGCLVGMVIPAVARMRIPELIAGAEATLRTAGYTLLLGSSGDARGQEGEQIERLLRDGVRGLIVYPVDGPSNGPLFRQLVLDALPVVLIDRYLLDVSVDAVVADNIGGAFLAVRHLIEHGYERIGFISTRNLSTSTIAERQAGYRWALEQDRRVIDPSAVCTDLDRLFQWPAPHTRASEHNQHVLQAYLSKAGRPDAVFAVNDTVAFQVLAAAEKAGLRVPDDLAVVGFDNLAYPDYGGVPLTSVEQPRQDLGATAASVLLKRIAGRRDRVMRVTLGTRLIVRRSSGGEHRTGAADRARSEPVGVKGT